jgi:hypothetical protein
LHPDMTSKELTERGSCRSPKRSVWHYSTTKFTFPKKMKEDFQIPTTIDWCRHVRDLTYTVNFESILERSTQHYTHTVHMEGFFLCVISDISNQKWWSVIIGNTTRWWGVMSEGNESEFQHCIAREDPTRIENTISYPCREYKHWRSTHWIMYVNKEIIH